MDKDTSKILTDRKKDHIDLAFKTHGLGVDARFDYEPLLFEPPEEVQLPHMEIAKKQMLLPIWVSSMTGGTDRAALINRRLAEVCAYHKMGFGLGSCRPLLQSAESLADFDLRDILGDDVPFFTNFGIAQMEYLIASKQLHRVVEIIKRLRADGLIIHVNPLQEWLQPEGDLIRRRPLDTLQRVLEEIDVPVIVKEVGQGFGPKSLEALMQLPLEAIEFGAHGGTNFAKLEMLRAQNPQMDNHLGLANIGHTPDQMVSMVNTILAKAKNKSLCNKFIISGGINDYLTGYYYMRKIAAPAVYGQASALLHYAMQSTDALFDYIEEQKKGLLLSYQILRLRHHG